MTFDFLDHRELKMRSAPRVEVDAAYRECYVSLPSGEKYLGLLNATFVRSIFAGVGKLYVSLHSLDGLGCEAHALNVTFSRWVDMGGGGRQWDAWQDYESGEKIDLDHFELGLEAYLSPAWGVFRLALLAGEIAESLTYFSRTLAEWLLAGEADEYDVTPFGQSTLVSHSRLLAV